MNPLQRAPFVVAFFLAALAGSGCAPRHFSIVTPPGFVEFEDRYPDQEYRAATADGVVIGARSFDNEPKGELTFWVRAVQNRLRDMGGYALLETKPVTDRGGLPGQLMRFGHDEGAQPHLYLVAVFVSDDRVFVVEAGGPKDLVERQHAQIDWAIHAFLHK